MTMKEDIELMSASLEKFSDGMDKASHLNYLLWSAKARLDDVVDYLKAQEEHGEHDDNQRQNRGTSRGWQPNS